MHHVSFHDVMSTSVEVGWDPPPRLNITLMYTLLYNSHWKEEEEVETHVSYLSLLLILLLIILNSNVALCKHFEKVAVKALESNLN